MPEDGQYNQNILHVLTELIKFVVFDSYKYVSFNIVLLTYSLHTAESFLRS